VPDFSPVNANLIVDGLFNCTHLSGCRDVSDLDNPTVQTRLALTEFYYIRHVDRGMLRGKVKLSL
jgi:hypothetical protein